MPSQKNQNNILIEISEPTLRRLPIYYTYLKRKSILDISYISGSNIAKDLDLKPIQVRKDLQAAGAVGKPKIGYEIEEVLASIENCLGYNNTKDALLVGAGNLGLALLGYNGFDDYGLNIVAAFDNDPLKIGTTHLGKKIYDIKNFSSLARRLKIQIGIITTPALEAKRVCQMMVESDVRGIWNFAPVHLSVPDHVIVQNVNLTASLSVLSNKLKK